MKKLLKILGITVLVMVVLVVGAAIALPMLVDPQDVKNQLSARVKEHTGRELSIPGEVKLSVFPWLGASLGEVSLGNAPGFKAPVFARTSKVDVRVKLMPLLDRRVEMDTVVVHGLTLNLERDKQGATNWGDLAGAGRSGAAQPASGAPQPAGSQAPALAVLSIGGLDVRDGTLSFTDARAGQAYTVRNLTLKTGALSLDPGQKLDLELGFDLNSASPPLDGRVKAKARLAFDQAANQATISDLDLTGDFKGATLPRGALSATLGADAVLDLGKHTLVVRNLKAQLIDLVATGSLNATGLDKTPAFTGELNLAEFSPRKLLEGLGQPAPKTADAAVLSRASLNAKFAGGADALSVEPLSLKLDDSIVTGKAAVSNFAKPAIRFALALDAIDVDRYLPPGQQPTAASPGAVAGAASGLPLDTLRALDAAGIVKAGKLEIAKLNLSEVTITLDAKDGLLRMSPLAAKLYNGSYAGNITLDARKNTPTLAVDEKIAGVLIEPLLTDLQGEQARLSGTAEASAKLTAAGADAAAIKKTLNGNLAFALRDGAVKGYDIAQMIRNAKSYLGTEVAYDAARKTDFAEIVGTAKVSNGVISNPDLSAKSPLLRVDGNGQASLPDETIDYRVKATLVATSQGQGGKAVDDLSGIPLPIHITGTFSDPKPRPDFEALMQGAVAVKGKELIEQQKSKLTEKVQESVGKSVGDKAGGLLKGLLK